MTNTFIKTLRKICADKSLGHLNASISDIKLIRKNIHDTVKNGKLIQCFRNTVDQQQVSMSICKGVDQSQMKKKIRPKIGPVYIKFF